MISFKGNFTQSAVNSSTNESAVTFGTDIKNSNVFLSTDIKQNLVWHSQNSCWY